MKLKDNEEICDKCNDRLARNKCIGCEAALCPGCANLFRVQIFTLDFETPGSEKDTNPHSLLYDYNLQHFQDKKTNVGTTDWAICNDCRKALNKKDAIQEIQESEEMKAFIKKIRKTALASKILTGLDDKNKVDEDIGKIPNVNDRIQIPKPYPIYIPKTNPLKKWYSMFNKYKRARKAKLKAKG
jgi:hypothetical protein